MTQRENAEPFTGTLRDWYAGQAISAVIQQPLLPQQRVRTEREVVSEAYRIADAMLAARSPAPEEGEADPKERLPRDADIILEALNEYDAFMLDDDYDAQGCLTRIMKRMRERYEFVDRSPQSDQSELLREALSDE